MRNRKIQAGGGYAGVPLYPAGSSVSSAIPITFLDAFSMTDAVVYDLQKRRSDYTGYAVRAALAADSGATTLDIGFDADGLFDIAAYQAFGTGSERIITWYDQSGNGIDLTRAWSATLCPIIRVSASNGLPCIWFDGQGSLSNAGFTYPNGKTYASFYTILNPTAQDVGLCFSDTAGLRVGYGITGSGEGYFQLQGGTQYNKYLNYLTIVDQINLFKFDGTQPTDATKAKYFRTGLEMVRNGGGGGSIDSTIFASNGLAINALPTGVEPITAEWSAMYVFSYEVSDAQNDVITQGVSSYVYNYNSYNLFCLGDSLTYGSGSSTPGSNTTNTYPAVTNNTLASNTGVSWNLRNIGVTSEVGAKVARVTQLNVASGLTVYYFNPFKVKNVAIVWCGTNNLGDGDSAATTITANVNLINDLRGWGFTDVYCMNMLPRLDLGAGNAAFEAKRVTFNADLPAAISGIATLIDVAGVATLQNPNDTTYYDADKVHLNDTGYGVVADTVVSTITV